MLKAVEFYSGIGAFAEACRSSFCSSSSSSSSSSFSSSSIEVVAAFDQSQAANLVYEKNFHLAPFSKNLDTIKAADIPQADLWWMSPPCTPFSVRGNRRDLADPRSRSLVNLIGLIPDKLPQTILIENVSAFKESQAYGLLASSLNRCGYLIAEFDLCPTMFGIPMRRPRHFLVCCRGRKLPAINRLEPVALKPLSGFLRSDFDEALLLEPDVVQRYEQGMNIVSAEDDSAVLICFTRGYWRCRKASGSLLALSNGRVRRVAPEEMLRLFGFSATYGLPAEMSLSTKFALIGNSVHVPAIEYLLKPILAQELVSAS